MTASTRLNVKDAESGSHELIEETDQRWQIVTAILIVSLLLQLSTPGDSQAELSKQGRQSTAGWHSGFGDPDPHSGPDIGQFGLSAQAVPGGIVIVDLGPQSLPLPTVTLTGRRILVLRNQGRWHAIIGVSLATPPGSYEIDIFSTVARKSRYTVHPLSYPQQHLQITDASKVTPSDPQRKLIARESQLMSELLQTHSPDFSAQILQQPLQGRVSSRFGLRRFYNGLARSPHSGFDLAAPIGTPVQASADGVVIDTSDYFFHGATVFIDHGRGLLTGYSHLHEISVEVGQSLKQGDVIGSVGMSGRATGPHLHWSTVLNGEWVNPELMLNGR